MKIKKNNKKGFTIVELVIVIAVIGILAAILIPTFISLNNKARMANTESFLKNINTQLAMKEADSGLDERDDDLTSMTGAVEYAKSRGFDLEEISPFAGNEIVWDELNHRFAFVNGETINYAEKGFKIANAVWMPDTVADYTSKVGHGLKVYLKAKVAAQLTAEQKVVTVTNSWEAGQSKGIQSVKVESTSNEALVIRTNDDQCVVTIDSPNNDVNFFGFAKKINAENVNVHSLHIFGAVNELAVAQGHVEVENTGIVFDVVQLGEAPKEPGNAGTITNKGYIAETTYSDHYTTDALSQATEERQAKFNGKTAEEIAEQKAAEATAAEQKVDGTKTVGGDLEINSYSQLKAFRDAVNAGNNFEGKEINLTKDITLDDGWKPIGEGTRKIEATNNEATGTQTFFRGHFHGNGHTINNLNNKGFEPTNVRVKEDQYAYGLFALVGDGASFDNLTLANVDIDQDRYGEAEMDSVGGLVGFANGDLTVNNVSVSGSIKAADAVSGIVGRINVKSHQISITNCSNAASIAGAKHSSIKASNMVASGIVRFYAGAEGGKVTLTGNTNTGAISAENNTTLQAGISVYNDGSITFVKDNNTSSTLATLYVKG